MRKILFGVIITLIVLFTFKYCGDKKEDRIVLQESSALIQEQLKNVLLRILYAYMKFFNENDRSCEYSIYGCTVIFFNF